MWGKTGILILHKDLWIFSDYSYSPNRDLVANRFANLVSLSEATPKQRYSMNGQHIYGPMDGTESRRKGKKKYRNGGTVVLRVNFAYVLQRFWERGEKNSRDLASQLLSLCLAVESAVRREQRTDPEREREREILAEYEHHRSGSFSPQTQTFVSQRYMGVCVGRCTSSSSGPPPPYDLWSAEVLLFVPSTVSSRNCVIPQPVQCIVCAVQT